MEESVTQSLIPNHTSRSTNRKDADVIYSKIAWRLLPTLFLSSFVCYVDRTNISLAAVGMSKDLGISKTQYGTAASVFFVTYATLQIPSNVVLKKVGGPLWLGILLIGWGITASLTAFVRNAWQLYLMRILIGAFEAGNFPGGWQYLSSFFPEERMAMPIGVMTAGYIAGLCISAPIAGALLSMDGLLGLDGWQWLLLLEGIVPVLLGCFTMLYLPNSPTSGKFLSIEEQKIVEAQKCVNFKATPHLGPLLRDILLNLTLWANVVAFILVSTARYAAQFWTPIWIDSMASGNGLDPSKSSPESDGQTDTGVYAAFLSAIPYGFASIAAAVLGWSSARFRERKYHVLVPVIIGGCMFCLLPVVIRGGNLISSLPVLSLIPCAVGAIGGAQVALCMACLSSETLLVGLPWFNGLGNVSGMLGPLMVGVLVDQTGSYGVSMYLSGALMFVAGVIYLMKPNKRRH